MSTTLKKEDIENYNKKRQQIIELNSKQEAQYQITTKNIQDSIKKLNEMLVEDGILDIVITEENFREVYKTLKEIAEKDYKEGMKIIEEEKEKYREVVEG